MPLGQGILPAGAIGNQLSYMTRRAVLPKVVVQIYNSSPTACGLLSTAESEAGGVDSVIVNVQNQSLVNPEYVGFGGNFSAPEVVVGIEPASWSMCELVIPIPILLTELAIQEEQAIQSVLNSRFTDAGNAGRDVITNTLFNNTTDPLQPIGLPGAIDNGSTLATYGGINRTLAGNTFWQSKVYNVGAAMTRGLALTYLAGVVKQQGEKPTFGVCGLATWAQLAQDYVTLNERFWPNQDRTDTYYSGFDALEVAGVPIYGDPYCPESTTGEIYLVNTNYLSMRIHQSYNFSFMDFESMIPALQLAYTGCVVLIFTVINTKPKASALLTNITGIPSL
jgi:hypothetical protein